MCSRVVMWTCMMKNSSVIGLFVPWNEWNTRKLFEILFSNIMCSETKRNFFLYAQSFNFAFHTPVFTLSCYVNTFHPLFCSPTDNRPEQTKTNWHIDEKSSDIPPVFQRAILRPAWFVRSPNNWWWWVDKKSVGIHPSSVVNILWSSMSVSYYKA